MGTSSPPVGLRSGPDAGPADSRWADATGRRLAGRALPGGPPAPNEPPVAVVGPGIIPPNFPPFVGGRGGRDVFTPPGGVGAPRGHLPPPPRIGCAPDP